MTFDSKAFSRHLRARMALAGMKSSEELAEKSGVSQSSITNYLRGDSAPILSTACLLAEALGCTVNDLLGWES